MMDKLFRNYKKLGAENNFNIEFFKRNNLD